MVALHRGRLECAKALLRAGADPNYVNHAGDHSMFWAIDGGVEIIKLCKVTDMTIRSLEKESCHTTASIFWSIGSMQSVTFTYT